MALKDEMEFGFVLPCRSWEPIEMQSVRRTAIRADELGFRDLWVTENTLDDSFSLDPAVVLTYAAALTTRIRLGVSVVVLPLHSPIHVAHQIASLDYVSGGRAVLGVGLGRAAHYTDFGVPLERRVAALLGQRFLEDRDGFGEALLARAAGAHPAVGDAGGALQRRGVNTAEPDWRVRLLDGP